MGKKTIIFKSPNDIENFTNIVSKYPYDMDLKRGRFIVDAKSIGSVLNMGVNNHIEFKVYEDPKDLGGLWEEIAPYIVS